MPVRAPTPVGVNVTLTMQLWPAPRLPWQVLLDTAKSPVAAAAERLSEEFR